MLWLLGILLVLLVSLSLGLGLLIYAVYAFVGVMLASRYLAQVWSSSLEAERECTSLKVETGQTVAVNIRIKNRGRLPIPWLLVEDLLPRHALAFEPPNLEVQGRRVKLVSVRGNSHTLMIYQMRCHRRGYYQIGPLVLETGDVFGLHRRWRVLTEPQYLLVYPQVVPLQGFSIASRRPIGEVKMSYQIFEDPTRISGVREYRQGDSMRRIHWHASARTGTLQSKTYEPSTMIGATILLDFHQASYPRGSVPYRNELAVTMAASLANAVVQYGQQVGLITNARDAADRIRQEGWAADLRTRSAARRAASMLDQSTRLQPVIVPTRRSTDQLTQILETLARAELTDGLTFSQLVQETRSQIPRDASVIAILTAVTESTAIRLQMLRQQGYAVEVILNIYDRHDFADLSATLIAQGIPTRHLQDETSIAEICHTSVLR